jgi:hypothetical protein
MHPRCSHGRVKNVSAVYWQFCIKAVRNGLARPSPPQIAIHVTTPSLKCGVRLVRNSIVSQTKSKAKVLTGTLMCERRWMTIIDVQYFQCFCGRRPSKVQLEWVGPHLKYESIQVGNY